MFDEFKRKIKCALGSQNQSVEENKPIPISSSITENMIRLREQFPNSADLNKREMQIGNSKILLVSCEGMINSQVLALSIVKPLSELSVNSNLSSSELRDFFMHKSILSVEQREIFEFNTLFSAMMAGFVIIFIEGERIAFALAAHGFQFRSISQPSNEANELGPKEAFTEPLRINLSMVRRRIKSPKLQFELMTVGKQSKTDLCLIYLSDKTSPQLIREVRKKLLKINLDVILDSSYVRPYLENHPLSLFSSVGNTERPDVLCGKINEGRIAILVDGSPYALIVPYLFSENFKSFDDYARRPYFSTFVRILKYFSFYLSFILPGAYVGITTFHPELLPHSLLLSVASSEEIIPFSLMAEALFIYLVFEIMREAGIRLPSAVGHTIGIVGALVIGDAAVNAGLIGAPMVIVVAITAICAFSIPQLYEPTTMLRFAFIIIGGLSGLYGVALATALVSGIICSMNSMHIPMSAPLSPVDARWISDSILFSGVRRNSGKTLKIQNIKGSEIRDEEEI